MRILLAIDNADYARAALNMVARLNISSAEYTLLHVIGPIFPDASPAYGMTPVSTGELQELAEARGSGLLDEAEAHAQSLGLAVERKMEFGPAVEIVQRHAKTHDLTVVGGPRKSGLERMILGSVANSLVTDAESSILIVRGDVGSSGEVSAVLAYDQSHTSQQFLMKLEGWNARGLSKVTVVTSHEAKMEEFVKLCRDDKERAERLFNDFEDDYRGRCEALAAAFAREGVATDVKVMRGRPQHALSEAMSQAGADLLVLGARGHGFLERLTAGSVALDQAMSSEKSVLILRP